MNTQWLYGPHSLLQPFPVVPPKAGNNRPASTAHAYADAAHSHPSLIPSARAACPRGARAKHVSTLFQTIGDGGRSGGLRADTSSNMKRAHEGEVGKVLG